MILGQIIRKLKKNMNFYIKFWNKWWCVSFWCNTCLCGFMRKEKCPLYIYIDIRISSINDLKIDYDLL